jgi:hypothetical protein
MRRMTGSLCFVSDLTFLSFEDPWIHTSNFSSRSAFLAYPGVYPVEAGYPSTEASGESSQLAQISDLVKPHKIVRHAF